jgi:hypothetical protein
MQYVDVAGEHRAELSGQRIDAEIDRIAGHRVFERNGAGNGQRPQPREAIRKIPEPLAEEDAGVDRVGPVGADALRA